MVKDWPVIRWVSARLHSASHTPQDRPISIFVQRHQRILYSEIVAHPSRRSRLASDERGDATPRETSAFDRRGRVFRWRASDGGSGEWFWYIIDLLVASRHDSLSVT